MARTAVVPTHLATACRTWNRLQNIKARKRIEVDGNSLDIASVVAVAYYECIPELSSNPQVINRITSSVEVLMDHLDRGYCVYGVNTGFGGSADSRSDHPKALQAALLQLTQAGVLVAVDKNSKVEPSSPEPHAMPASWVRASIIVRANSSARGHSAVTLKVLNGLLQLLKHDITPIVPLRGSVSASGDLIPLSYIAGAVEGSPDIFVQIKDPKFPKSPRVISAHDALQIAGIEPLTMGPKEGLGLVNGTAVSAAVASLAMYESHQLAVMTQALSAMGVEAITGTTESFHPFISLTRPHDGQTECARNVLYLLQGSQLAIREKDYKQTGLIQDRYSFRSVPQWIGPQLEDLLLADRQITTELNSSCDNPLIDTVNHKIYCGANFQAVAVTSAMEKTRLCLQMLGKLIFTQSTELVDPNYNNGLPTNLVADDPCLSFTMKGVDISIAAYMAELAYVSHPVSAHIQTAEMRNQAVNSLALVSTRYTMQAVELVSLMSAAYLYMNCQALDLRAIHLMFLEKTMPHVAAVTSQTIGVGLKKAEQDSLSTAVKTAISTTWPTTTRIPIADRCKTTAQGAVPAIINATSTASIPLGDLHEWQIRTTDVLRQDYQEAVEQFTVRPHTAKLLGVGSKILYQTVRETLRVPFHRGFIEHPTAGSTHLDGREKKTVGSWVSIIYEALRKGELQAPLLTVLQGVE